MLAHMLEAYIRGASSPSDQQLLHSSSVHTVVSDLDSTRVTTDYGGVQTVTRLYVNAIVTEPFI